MSLLCLIVIIILQIYPLEPFFVGKLKISNSNIIPFIFPKYILKPKPKNFIINTHESIEACKRNWKVLKMEIEERKEIKEKQWQLGNIEKCT